MAQPEDVSTTPFLVLVSCQELPAPTHDSGVTLPRFTLNDFQITALPPGRTEIRGNEREIGALLSSQYGTQTAADCIEVSSDGNAARLSNTSGTDLDGEDERGNPVLIPRGTTAPIHRELNLTLAGMLRDNMIRILTPYAAEYGQLLQALRQGMPPAPVPAARPSSNRLLPKLEDLGISEGRHENSLAPQSQPEGRMPSEEHREVLLPSGESGRWAVQYELLGEGACSRVFRGYSVRNPRNVVAVKYFKWIEKKNSAMVDSFRQECRLLRMCQHDRVVKYRDKFESPYCLITECFGSKTLRELISHGKKLAPEQVLDLAEQMLQALACLHSRSQPIAHRDIKPENILVSTSKGFSCKLADFGSATDQGQFGPCIGTREYQPPEFTDLAGRARRRYKCDIWSLGVALLECAAGLPAYQSSGGHDLNWFRNIGSHFERNRDSLSRVGPGFTELLAQMLAQTPSSRPEATTCLNRIQEVKSGVKRKRRRTEEPDNGDDDDDDVLLIKRQKRRIRDST
ncbi:hypothetical protein DL769_005276 [Monosporascus sp. CRB-8-3]|nr:hypothetical protein DL769_005276 [Monosporascus sp. CRB-8-3]